VHQQALYHLPLLAVAPLVVLGPLLGATLSAFDFWRSSMRNGVTAFGKERIAEFSHVQIRGSELEATISQAQLLITSTLH
jgi:hypothetical protein